MQATDEALAFERKYMMTFGEELEIEPADALLRVLQMSWAHLLYLRHQISLAENAKSLKHEFLLHLWNMERERVAKIAKMALDAGVAERRVQLAEKYGEMLAELLRGIFWDQELALTNRQHRALPEILKRHLLPLEAGAAGTDGGNGAVGE
jgi:hypothetical protein